MQPHNLLFHRLIERILLLSVGLGEGRFDPYSNEILFGLWLCILNETFTWSIFIRFGHIKQFYLEYLASIYFDTWKSSTHCRRFWPLTAGREVQVQKIIAKHNALPLSQCQECSGSVVNHFILPLDVFCIFIFLPWFSKHTKSIRDIVTLIYCFSSLV